MWLKRPLKIAEVRKQAEIMELETRQFYQKAMGQVTDAGGPEVAWRSGRSRA